MSEHIATHEPSAAPKNLLSRLVGVIVSPKATFQSIVAHPKWFGATVVIAVLMAALQFAFLSTTVGQVAQVDQQVRQMESFGMTVTPEMEAQFEAGSGNARYWAAGAILLFSIPMTALFAAIGYGIFTAMMGGSGTFKQVMAVFAHAGAVSLLGQLFLVPLNYFRESMSSATNLAVFLPFLDEGSVLARFAGMIDLFILWWLVVLAMGFAVLYRRKTAPVFASFAGIYVLIAAVIAIVMSAMAGSR
jgi:hypothetical protein